MFEGDVPGRVNPNHLVHGMTSPTFHVRYGEPHQQVDAFLPRQFTAAIGEKGFILLAHADRTLVPEYNACSGTGLIPCALKVAIQHLAVGQSIVLWRADQRVYPHHIFVGTEYGKPQATE